MPQDSHIPFYHTTIRRKLQEVFKIFLRKLCGVKFPSKCNSKYCCCGCLDNLRICLLADGSTCPCRPLRGGLPSLSPACPPLACFVAPIPPPALAERSSPPGKGEIFCFLMQGASPLASPRAEPGRHWETGANHAPCVGLPYSLPANRAFSLLSCPIPPAPLPGGKGESQSLFRRGLRPRHPGIKPPAALTEPSKRVPCAWEPAVRRKTERTAFPWAVPAAKERGTGGDGTIRRKRRRRLRWSFPPGQGEQVPRGFSPPAGHHSGKVGRRPTGQAPRHLSGRVSRPPKKAPPPHFFTFSPCQRRADVIQYAIESETV